MKGRGFISLMTKRGYLTVGVVGAGQMGIGIAQVALTEAKCKKVLLCDGNVEAAKKSVKFMTSLLAKNVEKKRMTEEQVDDAISRLHIVSDLKDLSDSDFVIEAISENTAAKLDLFKRLDGITRDDTILASNTSSISITKLASAVKANPGRVVGMHFMNPVPVMKLVELIRGLETSDETLSRTVDLAKAMGKVTTLSKDVPGFVANRILMPYINEAVFVLEQGIATKEDIDTTMKLGTNVPMGPLTLADFIGLDTCLAILRVLYSQLGDPKYRPCPLLIQYVDAGFLGKKTKRGFYKY